MIAFSELTSTLRVTEYKINIIDLDYIKLSSQFKPAGDVVAINSNFVLMVIHGFLLNLNLNLNPNVVVCMLVIVLYLMPALNSLLSLPVTIALLFVIFLDLVAYNCLPVIMLSVPF